MDIACSLIFLRLALCDAHARIFLFKSIMSEKEELARCTTMRGSRHTYRVFGAAINKLARGNQGLLSFVIYFHFRFKGGFGRAFVELSFYLSWRQRKVCMALSNGPPRSAKKNDTPFYILYI